MKNITRKNLFFLILLIFAGACKDKEIESVEPEQDYVAETNCFVDKAPDIPGAIQSPAL